MDRKYPASEKLKNRKEIALLFEKGTWISSYPLKVRTIKIEAENQRVGVSVSKRFFKKAVDRNQIKRWLREAYRLNKELYLESFGKHSASMIFYTSHQKPQRFSEIEQSFIKLCAAAKPTESSL